MNHKDYISENAIKFEYSYELATTRHETRNYTPRFRMRFFGFWGLPSPPLPCYLLLTVPTGTYYLLRSAWKGPPEGVDIR